MISFHPTAKDARSANHGWLTSECIEEHVTKSIWSGAVWAGGTRKESNFEYSDWACLDFDTGEMSLSEAVRTFVDCHHIIGTTRSHGKGKGGSPPCDRFRVAIPWSKRITDRLSYRYNMQELVKSYPCDSQCIDGARLYFPCVEIISLSFDGFRQEVKTMPSGWGAAPAPPAHLAGSGKIPHHVNVWLSYPAKPGRIRHTYFKIGAALHALGFSLQAAIVRVAASPVGKHATAPDTDAEAREVVAAGWYADRSKGGK